MTLKVSLRCSDAIHVIEVSSEDPHGFELSARITHESHDYEYDMACYEFKYPLAECYKYKETIEKGFNHLFSSDHLCHEFMKAVSEQPDGLGIDNGELAERIIEFMGYAFEMDDHDSALWVILQAWDFLPWFYKTPEFKRESSALARIAYDWQDADLLFEIIKIDRDSVTIKHSSGFTDNGDGHAEVSATFIVMLGEYEVDRWDVHYIGWYWDIDTMEWHVERHDSSETPDDRTEVILEALGYKDVEEFEISEIEPEEPGYQESDDKGDWAVFLDDDLWGQYKSEDRASQTYNAMMDAEDFSGHSSGRHITLRHRTESDEEWEEVE